MAALYSRCRSARGTSWLVLTWRTRASGLARQTGCSASSNAPAAVSLQNQSASARGEGGPPGRAATASRCQSRRSWAAKEIAAARSRSGGGGGVPVVEKARRGRRIHAADAGAGAAVAGTRQVVPGAEQAHLLEHAAAMSGRRGFGGRRETHRADRRAVVRLAWPFRRVVREICQHDGAVLAVYPAYLSAPRRRVSLAVCRALAE